SSAFRHFIDFSSRTHALCRARNRNELPAVWRGCPASFYTSFTYQDLRTAVHSCCKQENTREETMKLRMALLLVGLVVELAPLGLTNPNADAQTETILYSFGSYATDGSGPSAGLVQGSDGSFYGTTYRGGTGTNCVIPGCGTVFRISPSGTYTTVYSFG